jgi:hypothetical protein
MVSVPEKDIHTKGEREKAGYCEYRDGCDDGVPEFHVRE